MRRLLFFILIFSSTYSHSQVFCTACYNQVKVLNPKADNMIVNGSFETNNCSVDNTLSSFVPLSSFYNCSISGWTVNGGGTDTRACTIDTSFNSVPDGNVIVYLGNSICKACSSADDDISCIKFTGCEMPALPQGFPVNTPNYGGTKGVTLEQMMTGLVKGNAYSLEFWAGGECFFSDPGLFAVDVGFGNILLECEQSCPSSYSTMNGKRYMVSFVASAASQNLKFTSWGHVCSTCTAVCLDDVHLYPIMQSDTAIVKCFIPCSIKIEKSPANIFSPNNDGINDVFFPFVNLNYQYENYDFKNYDLQIFDRWGIKVFETSDLDSKGWNGITLKNKKADEGIFYWIVKGISNCSDAAIDEKGFVSLVR